MFVYLLRKKSDTIIATRNFLSDVAPYGNVKCLRSDNGTEFSNNDIQNLLLENKIKHEFSAPYSPHQNGTAERAWRSIFEMTRCLLIEAGLPKSLWSYAVKASAYIRNRCFNNRTKLTAFECFTSNKPNICNMHVFGSKCYTIVQDKKKLDDRCEVGVFIGYDQCSPAYLVYCPDKNVVKRVRCVRFLNDKLDVPVDENENPLDDCKMDDVLSATNGQDFEVRKNPERTRKMAQYLNDYVTEENKEMPKLAKCAVDYCYKVANIPNDYHESINSPDSEMWKNAVHDEIHSLKDNNTFSVTTLPEGKSTIGSKWVFSVKTDVNIEVKYKARLVAKGFSQKEGFDYAETFSKTAKIVSIRMLMQLAVNNNFTVHEMDVKSAYLNANLEEELYLDVPDGLDVGNHAEHDKFVLKLNKSQNGLKQSGRNWNAVFHSFICSLASQQSLADPCMYSKYANNALVVIIIFVDDVLISSNDEQAVNDVKCALSNPFKMKDLGCLSYFLGIDFLFSDGCIEMHQARCIEKVLERFNMSDCKPKVNPCDPSIMNLCSNDSNECVDSKLYQEIVGSLIYLMTCTRPDITFVVTKLSECMNKPTRANLNAAKHVLRYLKGTKHYSLKFSKSESNLKLTGFCDSDWAGSHDRKSISGYAFLLNEKGPLISYKSKKQNIVALSSCEAEYVSMTVAIQEAKFLSQLLADMTCNDRASVTMFVDNQGTLNLAKNPVHHQRSKHIDVKYHFIRLEIANGNVDLKYVQSEENVSDIFTKPVSRNAEKYILSD